MNKLRIVNPTGDGLVCFLCDCSDMQQVSDTLILKQLDPLIFQSVCKECLAKFSQADEFPKFCIRSSSVEMLLQLLGFDLTKL